MDVDLFRRGRGEVGRGGVVALRILDREGEKGTGWVSFFLPWFCARCEVLALR